MPICGTGGGRYGFWPIGSPHPLPGIRIKKMLKKILIALTVSSIALAATACNTVRGAGNDLESAANSVDKAT